MQWCVTPFGPPRPNLPPSSICVLSRGLPRMASHAAPPQVEVGTPILRATALSATAQGKCDGLTGHTKVQCEKKGDDKTEAEKDAEEADKDAKVQKSTCATFVDDKQACCKASGEAGHLCSYDVSRTDLQNTFAGYIRGLCVPKGEASEDACERMTATFQDRDAAQGGLGETQDFLAVGDKDSGSSAYVTPTQLASNQPYPGIDYLGAGYDIIHGAPSSVFTRTLSLSRSVSLCLAHPL